MKRSLVSWRILGTRSVSAATPEVLCGADVAVELDDGSIRAFGLRTRDLYDLGVPERDRDWNDGYLPIAGAVDPNSVGYWDFDRVLWLGPEPRPCLVWSNATGFTERGLGTVLEAVNASDLFAGRDGSGLPELSEVRSQGTPADG